MEDSGPGTSGLTNLEKIVGMDLPHSQDACQQHPQTGSDLESTGGKRNKGRPMNTWCTDNKAETQRTSHSWKEREKTAQR